MGRRKALLPIKEGTLLEHVLLQVEGYFDDILVSLSPGQRLTIVGHGPGKDAAGRRSPRSLKGRTFQALRGARPSVPRCVRDAAPGQGPMAGILAGLKEARHEVCAVIACDIPDIRLGFLRRLVRTAGSGFDVVLPVSEEGLAEPLFAVYRRAAAPAMENLLASGTRSLLPLFERVKTCRLPLKNAAWLKNLNTPDDYRAYLKSVTPRAGRPPISSK